MRWTELTLIPTALAMAAPVQWVACAGGPAKVKATTRSAISGLNGGMRDGRVLSRHSPAAPSEPNRSCQRQMTVLAFPVRRMISAVPCPAAVSRTILARQTCFCGLFRLATTTFNAARSVALSLIWVLSCIPQTRMTESAGESARESKSQTWSTRKQRVWSLPQEVVECLEFTETSGDAGPRTSRPGFQSGAGLLASLVRFPETGRVFVRLSLISPQVDRSRTFHRW